MAIQSAPIPNQSAARIGSFDSAAPDAALECRHCQREALFASQDCSAHIAIDADNLQSSKNWVAWMQTLRAIGGAAGSATNMANFSGALLSNPDSGTMEDLKFSYCQFENVTCLQARMDRSVFSNCRLVNSIFRNSSLAWVRFENCELAEIRFEACDLYRLDLENTRICEAVFLKPLSIRGGSLRSVTIENCDLSGIDLTSSRLRNVVIKGNCCLAGTRITRRQLKNIQFEQVPPEARAQLVEIPSSFSALIRNHVVNPLCRGIYSLAPLLFLKAMLGAALLTVVGVIFVGAIVSEFRLATIGIWGSAIYGAVLFVMFSILIYRVYQRQVRQRAWLMRRASINARLFKLQHVQ